ncbi:MAG TPA: Hpt domain-containing protein, partial [Limnochordales bacterium]
MSMDELSAEEIALFLNESAEMVDTIEELLVDLEKGGDPEAIAAIFRAAHTLKGGSATAGMTNMARLTHALESLLDLVRSGQRAVDADIVDALLEAIDVLRRCLAAVERDGNDRAVDVGPLAHRLESLARGWGGEAAGRPASAHASVSPAGAPVRPGQYESGVSAPPGPPEGGVSLPPAASARGGEWEKWAAQAAAAGEHLLRFVISVDPEAPMPVVRLYQALLVLQERGRVLQTDPPQREIEEGLADHTRMAAVLATAHDPAEIKQALGEVSHVQSIEWETLGNEGAAGGAPAAATVRAPDAAPGAVPSPASTSPVAPATPAAAAPHKAGAVAAPEAQTEEGADGTGAGGPQGPGGASPTGASGSMADTIRVSVRVLDKLMNLVGELVIDRTRIARLGHVDLSLNDLREELELVTGHLSRITTDLQDTIMQARMVPVETLFRKFPRMVRDLARRLNKQVRFVISGEDTELDRAVIEQIGDPLVHLIRNAIDHGVEP